ncbi:endo-1,4-beta-xylanase [Albibacterium profundi]|uniref:Beta-xylanase n=1 Tax=Albibacterium profundi TaxID=3134906 RepID=A0ABV5CB63_9SPHI
MNILRVSLLTIGLIAFSLPFISVKSQVPNTDQKPFGLKDAFEGKFLIGTALNMNQIWRSHQAPIKVLKQHFNSIVAENSMKSMFLQPREGEFNFKNADLFVEFGKKNDMEIIGHTLIWHSQAPRWFFSDKEGQDVSREVLIERMRQHIHTVVSRYKGQIKGWDVVNEVILDNGEWRKSKFYEIIGDDFIKLAFQFAHEADPEAELYYNDYNTAIPAKREGIGRVIKQILDSGGRVDAIGMQEHHGLHFPSLNEVENSIKYFSNLGVDVMVTEMDISVLPHARPNAGANISDTSAFRKELNPYPDGLPDDVMLQLGKRYIDFFRLYLKHQDKISRVTLWGISDKDSWLNNFPVRGRTNYPLLFDRQYNPKPFVKEIIALAKE